MHASDLLRIAEEIGGRSSPLVNKRKSVVYHLKNMSLDKVRILTKEDYRKPLRDSLNKELKKALTACMRAFH